ncbi:MAG: peptidase domain-containing ABC transporter [Casimicrobiaceae bacterium]
MALLRFRSPNGTPRRQAAIHHSIIPAELVWAVGSICNLQRTPFDAALIQSQYPPPHTTLTLIEAVRGVGFHADAVAVDVPGLRAVPQPCVVLLSPDRAPADERANGSPAPADVCEPSDIEFHGLALVVKIESDRVLYFRAGTNTPSIATIEEFAGMFAGVALAIAAAESAAVDDDPTGKPASFGFRWFVPELLKHKRIWRDVLLASLFIQLIALAIPLCSQIIIDKVIVHQTSSTLVVIAVALSIFLVFSAGLSWIRQYLVSHTGNRVDAVLGMSVFTHLFRLPVRYFEHRATGVVAARLHGVETIREFLSGAAVTLLLDCPFLVIFLALMLVYSVWLTLVTLSILAAIVAISIFVAPLFQQRLNNQFLLGARNQAFLTEYIAGMETVKSLQMEPQLGRQYEEYLATYLQSNFSTRQLANTYNTVANGLEQMMSTTILCLGAWLVMRNADFTIGMLVAFQMFANRISQPMLRLVGLWQQFQQATIAVRRLADVMNAPPEPYAIAPSRDAAGPGRIEFRSVAFRYRDEMPLLFRDMNFTVGPGQCVVVTGPSGCGKSTLAKLLQGFCMPTDGQVLIDGRDTRHFAANELRGHFGVVPQETTLFSGTIYDNLVLANPFATFDQVVRACKYAEIHTAIAALPKGYQTEIGERGVGLSGGQKQRIAIARALLKRPKILIFDEATSNLDQPTADHIARTVNGLKGKVTLLFISHQIPKGLSADLAIRIAEPLARASGGN